MKIASTAATDSAITSLAGLRLTGPMIPALALLLGRLRPAGRDAIAVVVAERAGRVLGEGVAVALAVRGAHERGDDVEIPLRDLAGLAPEVGQAEVDVELEQIDAGGLLGHATTVKNASDDIKLTGWERSGSAPPACRWTTSSPPRSCSRSAATAPARSASP